MSGRGRSRTRARDEDRSAACELIEAAYSDGQLSLEEHDERVGRALQARTIGDLRALTADLQGDRPPADEPRPRAAAPRTGRRLALPRVRLKGWQITLLIAVPAFSLGPILVLGAHSRALLTVDGLEALVEEARDDLGSTRVDDVSVFEKHAVLTRAQAGSPDRAERLIYRDQFLGGGYDEWTRTTRDEGETFVDLAKVDVRAAIDLLRRAPDLVHVSESSPERQHLKIESTDGGRIYIYVSNEFSENGWVIASLDGKIREVHPHDE